MKEVKAEFLLNYLYPECRGKWIVDYKGAFYRNYQCDIIKVDIDNLRVDLSRESFVKLLPASLLDQTIGKGKKSKNANNNRLEIENLNKIFTIVDTLSFRDNLNYEAHLSELNENKITLLLKEVYGYDLSAEKSEYVKEIAHLILRGTVKGDIEYIRNILSVLLSCKVETEHSVRQENEWEECFMSYITFKIYVEGLSQDRYRLRVEELTPLFDFVRHWFIPVDMVVEFKVIEEDQEMQNLFTKRKLLGYNTRLKKQL